MKKRFLILILVFSLLLPALAIRAAAAQTAPGYTFELSVNGTDTVEVNTGDIITVMLRLRWEGDASTCTMYGMQAELRYDSDFLELVEGAGTAYTGVVTTDIAVAEPYREYYMNYLSMGGGTQWPAETLVGTVQFRAIGNSGVTKITNEDFLVSLADGSGSYACTSNDLMLILSTDCTVRFQTNGGTEIAPATVIFGERLPRPEDPVRAGYHLVGWFTDIYLTEAWDFEEDTVQSNMTLYAKWEAGDPEPAGTGGNLLLLLLLLLLILAAAVLFWYLRRKKK